MQDEVTIERVREALRHVVDPEIGINIVDLGLVYDISVADGCVRVAMTMTTSACPMAESLSEQAETVVSQQVHGVQSVTVGLVWDPPWRPAMMSAAAKEQLGWKG